MVNPGNLKTQTLSQKRSISIDATSLVHIEALNPVKFSVEFLTHLVEVSAATEFINPKKGEKPPIARYDLHLKKLREEFIKIDPDNLGVYRPEEHLDNPMGLGKTESGINRNDRKLYDKFVGFIADSNPLHGINKKYGMKNYLRKDQNFNVEGVPFRTGYQYIRDQLLLAAKPGGFDNRECQIALGAGLHALEDFYAHTNYTEVALMKSVQPMVFPWVDEVAETGYRYDYNREYIRLTQNADYHILKDVDEEKYGIGGDHQIAAYIPIVTGTFGLIDTAASVLPVFNELFFGRDIDPWRPSKPGDRTEADVVLMELCKDLDRANNGNKEPDGNGMFTLGYKTLLAVRDQAAHVKEYVPAFIKKKFYWLTSHIALMYGFAQYFTIRAVAGIIGDAQVLLGKDLDKMYDGNFRIGQNPSHTQVAKDDTGHPLHELSALLAIEAVEKIADKMFKVWGGEARPDEVIDLLRAAIRHPVATDWQDDMVKKWGRENNDKICESCSPSVLIARTMHAFNEIDEALANVKKYVKGNRTVIADVVAYFELENGAEVGAGALMDFVDAAIAKSQEQMAKLMEIKMEWDGKFPKPLECLPNGNVYFVKDADNLWDIAKRGNTSTEVIIKMNHLISTELAIGQRLIVPYPLD